MGFDVIDAAAFGRQAELLYGTPAPVPAGDAPQPAAANPSDAAAGNAVAQPTDAEGKTAANGYNADLARILRNIGRETWKAVGKADLTALKELTAVKEDRKRLGELGKIAAKVEKNLSKLAKLDARTVGRAIADVCDARAGKGAASNDATRIFKLLTDSTDMLADISNGLLDLVNGSEKGGFRDACDELAMLCDSRASELTTLGLQMAEIVCEPERLAGYGPLQTNNFVELTKGMGGVMHDNYEAVAAMGSGDGGDSVGKLFRDLEGMSQMRSKDDAATADALKDRLTTLGRGLVADGERGVLSGAAVDRLRDNLRKMPQRTEIAAEYARRFIESQRIPFAEVLEGVDETACPILTRMRDEQEAWLAALEKVASAKPDTDEFQRAHAEAKAQKDVYSKFVSGLFADKEDAPGRLNVSAFRAELKSIVRRGADTPAGKLARGFLDMMDAAGRESVRKKESPLRALGRSIYGCSKVFVAGWAKDYFNSQVEKVGDLVKAGGSYSLDDIAKSILGRTDLSKPLLGRLYGVDGKYVDDTLSDDRIVRSEEGGAGSASKTEVISYYTGDPNQPTKEIVFKPDFSAAVNDKPLQLSKGDMYGKREGPRPLQLNIATHELGKLIGCSDITVMTTPLFHNGQLGLGMEKASGREAASFAFEDAKEIECLLISQDPNDRVKYRKIANDLERKTTDMQWLDILCGQGDRHGGNYMVGVDGDEVVLKTIDNDMSFGADRVGLTKVRLSEGQIKNLVNKTCECVLKHSTAVKAAKDKAALKASVGSWLRDQVRGGVFEYRSENCPIEFKWALQQVLGYSALMAPKVMGRKMAERLLALAADNGKGLNDFCERLVREKLLADWDDDDTYARDSVAALKGRFNEIVELIRQEKLILVSEPTEDNPTPWLDGKVVAAVRQKTDEHTWDKAQLSSLPKKVMESYKDEYKKVRRLDRHPMAYLFDDLILPAMLKASLAQA